MSQACELCRGPVVGIVDEDDVSWSPGNGVGIRYEPDVDSPGGIVGVYHLDCVDICRECEGVTPMTELDREMVCDACRRAAAATPPCRTCGHLPPLAMSRTDLREPRMAADVIAELRAQVAGLQAKLADAAHQDEKNARLHSRDATAQALEID